MSCGWNGLGVLKIENLAVGILIFERFEKFRSLFFSIEAVLCCCVCKEKAEGVGIGRCVRGEGVCYCNSFKYF